MTIIDTKNLKDKHVYNTMEFKIRGIKQINNEDFSENSFAESFIPSFCLLVYEQQLRYI